MTRPSPRNRRRGSPIAIAVVVVSLVAGACQASAGDRSDPAPAPVVPAEGTVSLGPDLFRPIDVPERYGELDRLFTQFVSVFGISVLATDSVSEEQVGEVADVIAELVDNDEDTVPDDIRVVDALASRRASIVLAGSEQELEASGFFEALSAMPAIDPATLTVLLGDELTDEPLRVMIERLTGFIYRHGWSQVEADLIGFDDVSALASAMDTARGGRFPQPPVPYPATAWFTVSDPECRYLCQLERYFTFALTSLLGLHADRCESLAGRWTLCRADDVRSTDPVVTKLLQESGLRLPTVIPDGTYEPTR